MQAATTTWTGRKVTPFFAWKRRHTAATKFRHAMFWASRATPRRMWRLRGRQRRRRSEQDCDGKFGSTWRQVRHTLIFFTLSYAACPNIHHSLMYIILSYTSHSHICHTLIYVTLLYNIHHTLKYITLLNTSHSQIHQTLKYIILKLL
jgi:hypothetical protein